LKKIEIPVTLKSKLDLLKHRLPIKEDFNELSDYILFTDPNFILVMEGLGLFDRSSIKQEFHSLHPSIKHRTEQIIIMMQQGSNRLNTIPHKQFIKLIREYL
jgi:hypothetical protein